MIKHRPALTLISVLAALALTGCGYAAEEYDAPPAPELVLPETGTFFTGDPIELRFSERVVPESLKVRIWSNQRDMENILDVSGEPLLEPCALADSPCGTSKVFLDAERQNASVKLDPTDLGQPDVPLVLEIMAGLKDETGAVRTVPTYFDFQFKPPEIEPSEEPSEEPVDFDDGVYIVVSQPKEPVPGVVITLITDIRATPDGRIALVGAEGDEIGEAPRNTKIPTELMVDATEEGFAIFALGTLTETEGVRFIESEPFAVNILVAGIAITLEETRLTGRVVKHPETDRDRIEGTLSFSGVRLVLNEKPVEYGGGAATFIADVTPTDQVPDGTPQVCGDTCGNVGAQCVPPDDFPAADSEFCVAADD